MKNFIDEKLRTPGLFSACSLLAGGWSFAALTWGDGSTMTARIGLWLYLISMIFSVAEGNLIKTLPQDIMEYVNSQYHKWSVGVTNFLVGFAAFRISLQEETWQVPCVLLICFAMFVLITRFSGMIAPHSFWARFRSAMGRGLILMTIWKIALPNAAVVALGIVYLGILTVSWFWLKRDQKKFDWAIR